jgi:hypothetical protein
MLENMSVDSATMPRPIRRSGRWVRLPTEPHARRVERLRRAFQRELGRKLTLIEKTAVFKAALLTAKAEAAALDPYTSVEELTKVVNLADRAVRRLPLDGLRRRPTPAGLQRARARWAAAEEQARAEQAAEKAGAATAAGNTDLPDARDE